MNTDNFNDRHLVYYSELSQKTPMRSNRAKNLDSHYVNHQGVKNMNFVGTCNCSQCNNPFEQSIDVTDRMPLHEVPFSTKNQINARYTKFSCMEEEY